MNIFLSGDLQNKKIFMKVLELVNTANPSTLAPFIAKQTLPDESKVDYKLAHEFEEMGIYTDPTPPIYKTVVHFLQGYLQDLNTASVDIEHARICEQEASSPPTACNIYVHTRSVVDFFVDLDCNGLLMEYFRESATTVFERSAIKDDDSYHFWLHPGTSTFDVEDDDPYAPKGRKYFSVLNSLGVSANRSTVIYMGDLPHVVGYLTSFQKVAAKAFLATTAKEITQ